jgi:hypothetical protein
MSSALKKKPRPEDHGSFTLNHKVVSLRKLPPTKDAIHAPHQLID